MKNAGSHEVITLNWVTFPMVFVNSESQKNIFYFVNLIFCSHATAFLITIQSNLVFNVKISQKLIQAKSKVRPN